MSGLASKAAVKTAPKSRLASGRLPLSDRDFARRVFLVRPGQTPLSTAGVLPGRLDPELDLTGLGEAMAVADAVGRSGLKHVVCSPLVRAMDTAAPIAARAAIDFEIDERLVDRDYGHWAGKPLGDLIAHWGSVDAAPDIEPEAEVFARAMDAFLDLALRLESGAAAVVTHAALLQALLPGLDPRLEFDEPIPQSTGCFNVVEARGDTWRVRWLNVRAGGTASGGGNQAERKGARR